MSWNFHQNFTALLDPYILYSTFLDAYSDEGETHLNPQECVAPTWVMHGCHFAPERSPHTSCVNNVFANWIGDDAMADWKSQIGNLARTPGNPLLFAKSITGSFNDHRESRPRFNVSSERRRLLQHSAPITAVGHWRYFDSSSNLVFPGGLPSKY